MGTEAAAHQSHGIARIHEFMLVDEGNSALSLWSEGGGDGGRAWIWPRAAAARERMRMLRTGRSRGPRGYVRKR
jgi:hypothetical protein